MVCGAAPEQNVRQRLHQKNAGTNQYDQLDAGRDESTPIKVVAARVERRRHKRSVRCLTQRRQSAVSKSRGVLDGTEECCGTETSEMTGPPIRVDRRRLVNLPRQAGARKSEGGTTSGMT